MCRVAHECGTEIPQQIVGSIGIDSCFRFVMLRAQLLLALTLAAPACAPSDLGDSPPDDEISVGAGNGGGGVETADPGGAKTAEADQENFGPMGSGGGGGDVPQPTCTAPPTSFDLPAEDASPSLAAGQYFESILRATGRAPMKATLSVGNLTPFIENQQETLAAAPSLAIVRDAEVPDAYKLISRGSPDFARTTDDVAGLHMVVLVDVSPSNDGV